jgi:hypothetical protein
MKAFFFKKNLEKQRRSSLRKRKFVNYAGAKNVLLLYECQLSRNSAVRAVTELLRTDNKNVVSYGFVTTKTTEETETYDRHLFGKKQINFYGKPDKNIIEEIEDQEFDYLIDISMNKCLPLLYLAMYSGASMKISSHADCKDVFDFILDTQSILDAQSVQEAQESSQEELQEAPAFDELDLFKKIIFYLKDIQTSD